VVLVVAAALAGFASVPPASAHSVLLATEPANDAIVDQSPRRVLLRFNEPVESALGSIRVFDASGKRVDAEQVTRPSPREVAVAIDGDLPRGTYTVAWRVISADSDPINGAFVFHMKEPGPQPSGIAAQVLEETPLLVSAFYTGGRFFEFLLLLLCAGGVAALVYPLRSADERLHTRLYGLLGVSAAGLFVFALLGLPFQGAAAAGTGLGEAFRWDVISAVADTRYGNVELARPGLALTLLGVAIFLRRSSSERARQIGRGAAAALAVGLVMTPSFGGHASVSGKLALAADIAHVLTAAMWVGGLAFVVIALVYALEDRWPLATRSVPRFSKMALASVAILLVAGTVNGYLQVRAWSGLWETQYGLLLLAKVGLVLPLLGLGAFNNRYAVPRLRAGVAQLRERRRFLQAAGMELVIMVAVLGVTAVLVNAAPAKDRLEMHEEEPMAIELGGVPVHLTVEPRTAGRNEIHLEVIGHTSGMRPEFEEVKIAASFASEGIGPLQYTARSVADTGAYVARDANFPIPGDWHLRIEARRGEFDLFTASVSVQIQEGS
jgi:copper transport protein